MTTPATHDSNSGWWSWMFGATPAPTTITLTTNTEVNEAAAEVVSTIPIAPPIIDEAESETTVSTIPIAPPIMDDDAALRWVAENGHLAVVEFLLYQRDGVRADIHAVDEAESETTVSTIPIAPPIDESCGGDYDNDDDKEDEEEYEKQLLRQSHWAQLLKQMIRERNVAVVDDESKGKDSDNDANSTTGKDDDDEEDTDIDDNTLDIFPGPTYSDDESDHNDDDPGINYESEDDVGEYSSGKKPSCDNNDDYDDDDYTNTITTEDEEEESGGVVTEKEEITIIGFHDFGSSCERFSKDLIPLTEYFRINTHFALNIHCRNAPNVIHQKSNNKNKNKEKETTGYDWFCLPTTTHSGGFQQDQINKKVARQFLTEAEGGVSWRQNPTTWLGEGRGANYALKLLEFGASIATAGGDNQLLCKNMILLNPNISLIMNRLSYENEALDVPLFLIYTSTLAKRACEKIGRDFRKVTLFDAIGCNNIWTHGRLLDQLEAFFSQQNL